MIFIIMISLPVSFKEFVTDPVKAILFMCLLVIGYLYIDNKLVYKEQIERDAIRIEKLEQKVEKLENKLLEVNTKI